MTAGPSESFEAELALWVWLRETGVGATEVVGGFEGDGDAAIIVTPRIAVIAIAKTRFSNVGKSIRDRNLVAVDRGNSMIRQRTLSPADQVFCSAHLMRVPRLKPVLPYETFFAVLLLNDAMRSRMSGPTPGFL